MSEIKLRCYISWFDDEENKRVGEMHFAEHKEFKRDMGFLFHSDRVQESVMSSDFEYHWMQGAGVTDIDGKDLYEGDLVNYEYRPESASHPDYVGMGYVGKGKIVFMGGAFMIEVENTESEYRIPCHYSYLTFEKTGNTHEGEK